MSRRELHSVAFDMWALGAEASAVIGLRLFRLWACDSAAVTEAQRMVAEKIQAAIALPWHAVRGDLGYSMLSAAHFSLGHYGKAIRANRRRLQRRR